MLAFHSPREEQGRNRLHPKPKVNRNASLEPLLKIEEAADILGAVTGLFDPISETADSHVFDWGAES